MEEMTVKRVDLMGDTIMAAQDKEGTIWAGINFFCRGLGMSKRQRDFQVEKVKADKTLSKGCRLLRAGVLDSANEVYSLRLDFVPIWLSKITITKKMEQETPDLADKLLEYQLKAKDILAAAFLPQQPQFPQTTNDKISLLAQGHMEVSQRVDGLEKRLDEFEKSLPLLPNEADEVSNAVKKRVVEVPGGKTVPAYKNRAICQRTFMDAYRELKRNFNVGRYKDIKREQKAQALEVAGRYEPPLFLKEQIEQENAQNSMRLVPGGGLNA